jgi:hypothetical protein
MSASSRKARRTAGLAAVLLGVCTATPGVAQTGEPSQLGPIQSPDGEASREGEGEERATEGDGARRDDDGARRDDADTRDLDGIEVDRLGTLDTATIGILDPNKGGLGPEMWRETPRRVVASLLPRLPARFDSPALRELARRLLLSSSAPPKRKQAPDDDTPGLLTLRVDRLMAMGHYADAAELLRVVPRGDLTPALRRHRVVAALMTGRTDRACQLVDAQVDSSDVVFWQAALATCQRAQGQAQQANLTASLMREMANAPRRFLDVYDALRAGTSLPAPPYPPLAGALLVTSPARVPLHAVDPADPGLARAIATHDATPPAIRVVAGEWAAAAAMLKPAELRRLYSAVAFPETLRTAAADRRLVPAPPAAGALAPAVRRALRFQAAKSAADPAVRARILFRLLADAPADRYRAIAASVLPLIAAKGPQPGLIWFAGTAGRALYGAGRPAMATDWLMLAREEAVITPDAAKALTELWPYARLAGSAAVPMNGGLAAWREAQPVNGGRVALQESLLRAAFHALNERDARTWLDLAAGTPATTRPVPPSALIYALREAGAGERVGEVALLAVIGLGHTGLDDVHPLMLETALTALRRVGLEPVARRLAIEAALANGV